MLVDEVVRCERKENGERGWSGRTEDHSGGGNLCVSDGLGARATVAALPSSEEVEEAFDAIEANAKIAAPPRWHAFYSMSSRYSTFVLIY